MDLNDTLLMFCSSGRGLTKDMVAAEWKEDFNMKHHLSLHHRIEELWVDKSKDSVRLFNASKFRFHRVEVNKRDEIVISITFFLGTTTYKDFIGTNCALFAENLINDGITDYSDPKAYLSNPVGVGALLETDDKDLVFMRRSSICAEMPGLVDRPGGHPEPEEISSKVNSNNGSAVVDEIFDSVLKEIRDEINIPLENLSSPMLLGISFNRKTGKRPSLEFYVRCHLPTSEVLTLYSKQTQLESEESTDLVIIPVERILDLDSFKSSELYNELTHAAQSAIHCFKVYHGQ